jgi:hypothetical protein
VPDLTHLGVITFGLTSGQAANANKCSQRKKEDQEKKIMFSRSGDNQMLLLE